MVHNVMQQAQTIEKITQHKGFLLPESLHDGRDQCSIRVSVAHGGMGVETMLGLEVITLDGTENASVLIDSETAKKWLASWKKLSSFQTNMRPPTLFKSSPLSKCSILSCAGWSGHW